MKYVNKDAKAPAVIVLDEQGMKKILSNLGHEENSISNNSIIEKYGYVAVAESLTEQPTPTSILVADKENDGSWSMRWVEKSSLDDTKDLQVSSNILRKKRNELLAKTDWTQGKDISSAVSSAWTTYRQELRDITNQPGFPATIVWPTPPQ